MEKVFYNYNFQPTCTQYCEIAVVTLIPIILIFPLSLFIVYPIYRKVYLKNKDTDRTIPIYPIIQHFYKLSTFMQLLFFINISAFLFVVIYIKGDEFVPSSLISFGIFAFTYICIITVTSAQHLLLSFLALQRFLIFYFSSINFTIGPRTWRLLIWTLHFSIFTYNLILRVLKTFVMNYSKQDGIVHQLTFYDELNMRFYFGFKVLMLLCASLYIPIFVSIRKLTRLQSVRSVQPEKYILYQTVVLMIFQIFYMPSLIFISQASGILDEDVIYLSIVLVDVLTTHFIVQFSYLLCNRRNVREAFTCLNRHRIGSQLTSVEATANQK